jgi:hypothetical protein
MADERELPREYQFVKQDSWETFILVKIMG